MDDVLGTEMRKDLTNTDQWRVWAGNDCWNLFLFYLEMDVERHSWEHAETFFLYGAFRGG